MRRTMVGQQRMTVPLAILGLFVSVVAAPSPAFAETFWSFGFSGGSAGINGFTLSISDYCGGSCGIPVIVDRYGPPYGNAYGSYHNHPRRDWRRHDAHGVGFPRHMNRPDGHHRDYSRDHHYDQRFSRPNGYQQNHAGMNRSNQGMTRPNSHSQNFGRPERYQDKGPHHDRQGQDMAMQKREKQRQWETSMMNRGMNFPR